MSAHRFFLTAPLDAEVGHRAQLPLAAEDLHHAADVLRIKPGEEIEVVEPDASAAWRVRVAALSRTAASGEVLEVLERVYQPRVTLVQGIAKGEKMDAIVRQAVEVGADKIVPVLTSRSVVRLDGRKRAERGERWRRIAKSAAEQAHRFEVPEVDDPAPLVDVVPLLAGYDEVLVAWEDATGAGIAAATHAVAARPDVRVALVVGPEGGLAAEEVAALERIGATTVSLGSTILRTETAALVALVLTLHGLGGLGRD